MIASGEPMRDYICDQSRGVSCDISEYGVPVELGVPPDMLQGFGHLLLKNMLPLPGLSVVPYFSIL
jgi:hypothetical protein